MNQSLASQGLLRARSGHVRVTYVELFFDLIFVYAVTQLSHLLMGHLNPVGAFQTTLLLFAVWWAWIDTSWVTNWVDPDRAPVRALLFALMFVGLLLSAALPHAFEDLGLLFAASYATLQIGRSLFMVVALRGVDPVNHRNFQRICLWHVVIGALWIAGAACEGSRRSVIWSAAVALECCGPPLGFYVPGLGRSATTDWKVDGAHLAERCALFIIIALGESILVTGTTAAGAAVSWETVAAFVAAFLGTVAMWWIYFNIGAERGSHHIASNRDPGRMARAAYTYMHLLIVAGIVVCAVGDELVLSHAHGHVGIAQAAVIIGGAALYLTGNLLFKRASANNLPLSHLAGLGLLGLLGTVAVHLTLLLLSAATTAILIVVATWETISLRPARSG